MDYVTGEILTFDGFKKGHIGFNKSKIIEIGNNNPPKKPLYKGIICPTFINSHTHIGDSFIKDKKIKLPQKIEDLVAPPNGLKHKMLRESSDADIVEGMEKSIETMIKSGTKSFIDFREGGILGIKQLKSAINSWKISSKILSRPVDLFYHKNEIDILLNNSDGIGISSISDWDYSELFKISKHVKKKNKIFALHASERIREDIDQILDLKPDFLIHMLKATESDFISLKENNIPIVICPRSSAFFNQKPNYELMKKIKNNFFIGTDNAMLNSPSVIDEVKFIKNQTNLFSIYDLLYKVSYEARKALNLECSILGQDFPADFVVLDKKNLNTLYISK